MTEQIEYWIKLCEDGPIDNSSDVRSFLVDVLAYVHNLEVEIERFSND